MEAKAIANYGGPYTDAVPADNPETDLAADEGNRMMEDCAQATQTVPRAWVTFTTSSAAGPVAVAAANVTNNSVWGSGDGQKPTVTKTATGRYTITYATSFNDGLSVSESVAFVHGMAEAWSSDVTDDLRAQVLTIASNVVTLKTESAPGTLADVGNGSGANFSVTVVLR